MEQSTAYLIMILFPVVPWLLKLTISYKIRYKTPKLNVEKFYKKNKTPFIKKYFYVELKKRLNPTVFYSNLIVGCILLLGIPVSLVYLLLAICKHTLSAFFLQYIAMYSTIILTVFLLIFGTIEMIDDRKQKK
mgnify:CR=1 FL=1